MKNTKTTQKPINIITARAIKIINRTTDTKAFVTLKDNKELDIHIIYSSKDEAEFLLKKIVEMVRGGDIITVKIVFDDVVIDDPYASVHWNAFNIGHVLNLGQPLPLPVVVAMLGYCDDEGNEATTYEELLTIMRSK